MPHLKDEKGNTIWPLSSAEISADTQNGVIRMSLRYEVNASVRGEGHCPYLSLTPKQAVHLMSALQQVLALKGNVLSFRGRPNS